MALVKLKPSSSALNNQTTLPEVLSKDNESTFTSLYPASKVGSLLKYVEGYPWTVNYYGQIVNTANTLEHVDPSTPSLNQPYYEIVGAVLQVSSPLTNSYDEASAVTSVNGTALVPFKVTPNVGDLFMAQVDTGEDAFFIINSVQRKTHRKDTLYEINYALYQYASSNPVLLAQIKSKVQNTYYFNKDSDQEGVKLLTTSAEHQTRLDIKSLVLESEQFYFAKFLKKEVGTIIIPGVADRVYDPYLVSFIAKTVSHDAIGVNGFGQYTVFDRYAHQPLFWSMLLSRNESAIHTLNRVVSFASATQLRNRARFGTAYHSGIDAVATCRMPDTTSDIGRLNTMQPDMWLTGILSLQNSFVFTGVVKTPNNGQVAYKPLLHALFVNDSYVVSEAFYNYMTSSSAFSSISYVEWLLARFIRRESIPKQDVVAALSSYSKWSVMHQLYLLPALWLLAKN